MRTVKLIADGTGEREFSPEHALNILNYQVENHVKQSCCWTLSGDEWKFEGGMLTLNKKKNGSQSDTGIGDETPKRKRNSTGDNPQP